MNSIEIKNEIEKHKVDIMNEIEKINNIHKKEIIKLQDEIEKINDIQETYKFKKMTLYYKNKRLHNKIIKLQDDIKKINDINKYIYIPSSLKTVYDREKIVYIKIIYNTQQNVSHISYVIILYSAIGEINYEKIKEITVSKGSLSDDDDMSIMENISNFLNYFKNIKIMEFESQTVNKDIELFHIRLIKKFSFLQELRFNTLSVPELLINVLEKNKKIKNIKIMIITINDFLTDITSIEQLDVNDTIEKFILLYLYCKKNNININIPEQFNCQNTCLGRRILRKQEIYKIINSFEFDNNDILSDSDKSLCKSISESDDSDEYFASDINNDYLKTVGIFGNRIVYD
jgi:hypothetical protein